MSAQNILERLRLFMLGLAGAMFGGTVVELILLGHFKTATQLIPFALCVLGLAAAGGALLRPSRAGLLFVRLSAAVMALGTALGVYEHMRSSVALQLEVKASSSALELLKAAVAGASPLLAPGVLALAAMLALAATYYHPALAAARSQARETLPLTAAGRGDPAAR